VNSYKGFLFSSVYPLTRSSFAVSISNELNKSKFQWKQRAVLGCLEVTGKQQNIPLEIELLLVNCNT